MMDFGKEEGDPKLAYVAEIWRNFDALGNPILARCNKSGRNCVILTDPSIINYIFDVSWKCSAVKTLYLVHENDAVLQKAISEIVRICEKKLFLRLFSCKFQMASPGKPDLGCCFQALAQDDRSPPFRRVLVMAFRLNSLTEAELSEFLDQARHNVAELLFIETTEKYDVERWAHIMRTHFGAPEPAVYETTDKKAFIMFVLASLL